MNSPALIIFELLADFDRSIPRPLWRLFYEMSAPNPYRSMVHVVDLAISELLKLPYFSLELAPDFVKYGTLKTFKIPLQCDKVLYFNNAPHKFVEGTHVDATQLLVQVSPLNVPSGAVKLDKSAATTAELRKIYEIAAILYMWQDSIYQCAVEVSQIEAKTVALPQSKNVAPPQPKNVAFPRDKFIPTPLQRQMLGRLLAPRDITVINENGLAYNLTTLQDMGNVVNTMYAFYANDSDAIDEVLRERERNDTLFLMEAKRRITRNKELFEYGLIQRICRDLGISFSKRAINYDQVLHSLAPKHQELVQTRFVLLTSLIDNARHNGCEHKAHSTAYINEHKDLFYGPVQNHIVMCKLCHLELMCEHSTGEIPIGIYSTKYQSNMVCKYCGEILYTMFIDTDETENILDEEYKRRLYGTILYVQSHFLARNKLSITTRDLRRQIMGAVMSPLYDQYMHIENLRSIDAASKEHYYRIIFQIYVLVAFNVFKYDIMDKKVRVQSLPDFVRFIMQRNRDEIRYTGYDEDKIKGFIARAIKEIRVGTPPTEDLGSYDWWARTLCSDPTIRLLTGHGFRNTGGFMSADEAVTWAEEGRMKDLTERNLQRIPAWFRPIARWQWIEPGVLFNPPEVRAQYGLNRRNEVFRAFHRHTGFKHYKSQTFQRYVKGILRIVSLAPNAPTPPINIRASYNAIMGKGEGGHVIVEADDKETAKFISEIRTNIDHMIFVEKYRQLCPATTDKLHKMGANGLCVTCGATREEILTSLTYFDRFKAKFYHVNWHTLPPFESGTSTPEIYSGLPADAQRDEFIAILCKAAEIEPIYLQRLGDFYGRKIDETLSSNYVPRLDCARFQRLNNYLLTVLRRVLYVVNGMQYKSEFYDTIRPMRIVIDRKLADRIQPLVDRYNISLRLPSYETIVENVHTDLLRALTWVLKESKDFGIWLVQQLLYDDSISALMTVRDYVVTEEVEDANEQAESLYEAIKHDAFYEDFAYEGGENTLFEDSA